MVNPQIDWQLLRTFQVVLQEGSLSGAARILGTTQPTMGRQIAALEEALQVKLFARSQDGLTPTDAGLRLAPSVSAMAAAAEAAQRAASGDVGEERGAVRLTASDIMGADVLPPMLASFSALHPTIAIELALSNRNEDIVRGDADIAVRMVRPTQNALVAKRVGSVPIGLYAHRSYLARRRAPTSLAELVDHALIGYDRDPAYQRTLESFAGVRIPRDRFTFRSDSHIAYIAAVRAGLGIGACQVGIAIREQSLAPVLHDKLIIPLEIWLVTHPDLRALRRIRLLFEHLSAELAAFVQASSAADLRT